MESSSAKTFHSVDPASPYYATLCGYARRVQELLREPALQTDEGVVSTLDFLVGALHALLSAGELGFRDRRGRAPQTTPIREMAESLSQGRVRTDGAWLAGFHFNNALARLAAVYERALKIASGRRARGEKQKAIVNDALARYASWNGTAWSCTNISELYNEVNSLKHDPAGLYKGRNVEFDKAVRATDELLVLLEAWNSAGRP